MHCVFNDSAERVQLLAKEFKSNLFMMHLVGVQNLLLFFFLIHSSRRYRYLCAYIPCSPPSLLLLPHARVSGSLSKGSIVINRGWLYYSGTEVQVIVTAHVVSGVCARVQHCSSTDDRYASNICLLPSIFQSRPCKVYDECVVFILTACIVRLLLPFRMYVARFPVGLQKKIHFFILYPSCQNQVPTLVLSFPPTIPLLSTMAV
jgi:hypothetical protein